jgi:glycerate kinase
MRVLIAPGDFGSLTAAEAADAMARGWQAEASDVVTTMPLSDGGAGFVDAVAAACGGDLVPVTVQGPAGGDVPAAFLLVGSTAYLETSQVLGVHLDPHRDPTRTTSAGLAALLRAAVDAGATRVVVGCGPAASNDGGAGLLAALGAGDDPHLLQGALALADLADDALRRLADVRARWAGVELVAATDDDLPLLGFHGTSATYGEAHGATAEQAQQMERALGRYADVAQRSLVAGRALLGRGQAAEPGSGAGGGSAFALLLLGARRVSGTDVVLDAVGFGDHLARTDLLVTGAGTFDGSSLHHGVIAATAALALERGVPTVVVAGDVEVGRREALAIGVSGAYAVADRPGPATSNDPSGALADRARRVARTWSR